MLNQINFKFAIQFTIIRIDKEHDNDNINSFCASTGKSALLTKVMIGSHTMAKSPSPKNYLNKMRKRFFNFDININWRSLLNIRWRLTENWQIARLAGWPEAIVRALCKFEFKFKCISSST